MPLARKRVCSNEGRCKLTEVPSILPRFDFRAEYGVATDTGSKRSANEDAFVVGGERLGVQARGIMELDNIDAAKRMIERRLGIAFLPRSAVKRDLTARVLRLAKLADAPAVSQKIVVARRRDAGPATGVVAAFMAQLKES